MLNRIANLFGKRPDPQDYQSVTPADEPPATDRPYTEEASLYASGLTVDEIAVRLNLTSSQARYRLQMAGVTMRHRGRQKGKHYTAGQRRPATLSAIQRTVRDREWARLYEDGAPIAQIARTYGADDGTVRSALRRQNVEMRVSESYVERNAEIVRLRTVEHWSYQQIGEKYGITRERVRQQLKKAGVDLAAEAQVRRDIASQPYKERLAQTRICKICGQEMRSKADAETGIGMTWQEHIAQYHTRLMGLGRRSTAEVNEKRRQMADDYMAGMKTQELQDKYGVTPTTVDYALKQYGLKRNRRKSNRLPTIAETQARKEAIVADLRAGLKVKDIAKQYGCSDAWVAEVRKQYGLTDYPSRHVTENERRQFVADYRQGASINRIAVTHNRSFQAVKRSLQQAGAL